MTKIAGVTSVVVVGIAVDCSLHGASSQPLLRPSGRLEQGPIAAETTFACSPSRPTTSPLEPVRVVVFANQSDSSLAYTWSATRGSITGGGPDIKWDFSNSPIGMQTLTLRVTRQGQVVDSCTVQVLVVQPGPTRGPGDLIARALLLPGARELEGYGLYSYLLFGSQPSEASRQLYHSVIAEYVRLMPDINQFAEKLEGDNIARRKEINVSYIPLTAAPRQQESDSAEAILGRYDYARARALLSTLPGTHRDGPYLVSSFTPLSGQAGVSGNFLVQDLSKIPADLVPPYVAQFLNETTQERLGEGWHPQRWLLKLRTILSALGKGAPEVQKAWKTWESTFQN